MKSESETLCLSFSFILCLCIYLVFDVYLIKDCEDYFYGLCHCNMLKKIV